MIYIYIICSYTTCFSTVANKMSKKQPILSSLDGNEDPGVVFVLWPSSTGATSVHQCLGLASVSSIAPPLTQGRRIANEGVSSNEFNAIFYQVQPRNSPLKTCTDGWMWLLQH